MERGQFTFYASFYKAIRLIRKKSTRGDAYDAICAYALEGIEPEGLEPQAAIAFEMARPVLEAALRKAESGSLGGLAGKSKRKSASAERESKNEFASAEEESKNKIEDKDKDKDKNKDKNKNKVKNKCYNTLTDCEKNFLIFWDAYPRKVDKQKAKAAFGKVDVPVEVLCRALEEQRFCSQWQSEGGRYIPNPATWLTRRGWEDELPQTGIPLGATGKLGKEELENIQRLLREAER